MFKIDVVISMKNGETVTFKGIDDVKLTYERTPFIQVSVNENHVEYIAKDEILAISIKKSGS